jgi:hypothetical protein
MKAEHLGWILSLAIVVVLLVTAPALAQQEKIIVTYDTTGDILEVKFVSSTGVESAPSLITNYFSREAREILPKVTSTVPLGHLWTYNPHCVHSRTCKVY